MCGARRKQATTQCRRPAGWGTLHPGAGRCKLHAGSTVQGTAAAATELARRHSVETGVETTPAEFLQTEFLQKGTQETITVRRSKTDQEGEGTTQYRRPDNRRPHPSMARSRRDHRGRDVPAARSRQASPGVGSRLSPSEPSSGSDPPTPRAASRGTRSESAQRRASQRRARPSSRCKPPEGGRARQCQDATHAVSSPPEEPSPDSATEPEPRPSPSVVPRAIEELSNCSEIILEGFQS